MAKFQSDIHQDLHGSTVKEGERFYRGIHTLLSQYFYSPRMDQPANTQTQHQHEPISFGIDQILNSSDQENSSQPAPRGSDSTNYLGSPVSRTSAPYPSLPASFPGIGAPFEDSGSYSVNLSLAPAGVIRVPAHRPIPGAVPPPISSAIPAMPAVPSLGSLNFPWMESSRRFVKDRFTGKDWVARGPGVPCSFPGKCPAAPRQRGKVPGPGTDAGAPAGVLQPSARRGRRRCSLGARGRGGNRGTQPCPRRAGPRAGRPGRPRAGLTLPWEPPGKHRARGGERGCPAASRRRLGPLGLQHTRQQHWSHPRAGGRSHWVGSVGGSAWASRRGEARAMPRSESAPGRAGGGAAPGPRCGSRGRSRPRGERAGPGRAGRGLSPLLCVPQRRPH